MFTKRIKTHHSAMAEGKAYVTGVKNVQEVLTVNTTGSENATIYIHVPFCNKICSFCNMRRSLKKPVEYYADWIAAEIEQYGKLPYIKKTTFDAVFFGGGTPTTLGTAELQKILKALRKNFKFTDNAEFTIETTVTELTSEKLEVLVREGVNRFSVGVQTFDEAGRKVMGRIGSGEAAYEKLRELKSYDGVTVSMDLIYNYPGQTMESLYEDLDKIVELDLDGFSMYSLIDMKETSISEAQNEKNDEKMFFAISEYMQKAGYDFLELTKMVKRDAYKYIYNRHHGADTLPLGAGAGGFIGGVAIMNAIVLEEYEASVKNFSERKGMHFRKEYKEVVKFKGALQLLHLPENEALYQQKEKYLEVVKMLMDEGMITFADGRYRMTTKGIFWGNTISRELSGLIFEVN